MSRASRTAPSGIIQKPSIGRNPSSPPTMRRMPSRIRKALAIFLSSQCSLCMSAPEQAVRRFRRPPARWPGRRPCHGSRAPAPHRSTPPANAPRPPVPPEPILIAGMPRLIGMFASVEEISKPGRKPCALIAACARRTSSLASSVRPAGRSPIFRISAATGPFRVERAVFSAATELATRSRKVASSRASSSGDSERRSKSVQTLLGIELIDVPPPVTRGAVGGLRAAPVPRRGRAGRSRPPWRTSGSPGRTHRSYGHLAP